MAVDPVDQIGGLATLDNVSKVDTRAELKALLRAFADANDVRALDLSGRTRIVVGDRLFRKDTSSTLADDGVNCIIDAAGNHWLRIVTADGGFTPRGAYSGATTYELGDLVIHQNSSWVYINATAGSGNAPPTLPTQVDSYWQLVAQQGTAGSATSSADVAWTGDISPSQITADQDNYNPTGLSGAAVIRLSSDAWRRINGLAGGADGRLIKIINVGSYPIALGIEVASSTAANRFLAAGDQVLYPTESVEVIYDATSQRWRVEGPSARELILAYAVSARQWEDSRGWPRHGGLNYIAIPEVALHPDISFTRAGVAWDWGPNGDLREYPANVIRHAYDPVTRKHLGWRYSRVSRSNYVRNNTMQGCIPGSPGTVPTNWFITGSGNGLTRTIVGVGTEKGIDYIDVRWAGTTNAQTDIIIRPESNSSSAPAAVGQTWTSSYFFALVAGADPFSIRNLYIVAHNTGGAQVSAYATAVAFLATLTRWVSTTMFADATTAYAFLNTIFRIPSGVTVDFVLRAGLPQLERSSFATTPIKTAGSGVTVPGETMSAPIPSHLWSPDQYTLMCRAKTMVAAAGGSEPRTLLAVDDGTVNNRSQLRINPDGNLGAIIVSGGVTSAAFIAGSVGNDAEFAGAVGVKASEFVCALSGGAPSTSSSGAVPVGTSPSLKVGRLATIHQTNEIALAQFAYLPAHTSNADLQNISRLTRL